MIFFSYNCYSIFFIHLHRISKYNAENIQNIPLIKMSGPISELLHGADIHIRRVLTCKMNKIFIEKRYI